MIFIQNALNRYSDASHELRLFITVQWLVIKRYEANVITREPVVKVIALITVVSERARKVFYYDAVYSAASYIFEHSLKIFSLVVCCA